MSGKRVMIVDDSAFMRSLLSKVITRHGYEVAAEAENAEDALKKYRETKPDIVIMDIIMPEIDGITAVKELMKIDPDAKIIMCSSVGQEAMIKDAIEAGAKGFITKPFKEEKIIEELGKA